MKLTDPQRAALTSALAHPAGIITATPQTASALERRGLVIGRQLTPRGRDVANVLGASYSHCADCGKHYPSMKTLPTTGRDTCPACMRALAAPIMKGRPIAQHREEWSRISNRMRELDTAGHFHKSGRFER